MKLEINKKTIEFIETTMKPIQFLGIKVKELEVGRVVLSMPINGNMNPNGHMFGGYIFALADFIMGPLWVTSFEWEEMYNTSREATIRYYKPVISNVTAELAFPKTEIDRIEQTTREFGKCDFTFDVVIRNAEGEKVATVTHYNQMRLIK
jgi:thioesterase domain-containing protein